MNRARALDAVPDDADTFLRILGDRHTFQTFGEGTANGKRELSCILHGTLAEHRATLGSLNARGAAVCVMVNAGDCNGRDAANVQSVRALFVDLDGAPLEPVKAAPLPAHCIVESSPNRWHAYWRIADCPPRSSVRRPCRPIFVWRSYSAAPPLRVADPSVPSRIRQRPWPALRHSRLCAAPWQSAPCACA